MTFHRPRFGDQLSSRDFSLNYWTRFYIMSQMKAAILTNEFPPSIYGGAGIHVQFLTRELQNHCAVDVRCFGDQNVKEATLTAKGFKTRSQGIESTDTRARKLLDPLDINLQMAASLDGADVVHCHTWYTHFAGVLASKLLSAPLILTTHSLEPHRPWKHEQLGRGGYGMSCWIERTAYQSADGIIAVSNQMKKDVVELYGVDPSRVQVIYNGIDPDFYKPTFDEAVVRARGIDPSNPYVIFVGRITRQKGIAQLLGAIPHLDPETQVVLCAGAPDTPEIAAEMNTKMTELQAKRPGIIWIQEMMNHSELRILYSHAKAFVCPSLYEPFGIINLEAMSCGIPVVGSAVGGIPEIIVHGETGILVSLQPKGPADFEPLHPEAFQQSLATSLNLLTRSPDKAAEMGVAARKRAVDVFSWKSIAKQTFDFYAQTIERHSKEVKAP